MATEQPKGNKATEIALKSAVNDITRFMIDRRKHEVRVFRDLSEADQNAEIALTREAAFGIVETLNTLFASRSFKSAEATMLGRYQGKDAKVEVKIHVAEADLDFAKYKGSAVFVLTSMADFSGGSRPKPDKDQPDIPLEEPSDIREARERREAIEREAFEQSEAQRLEGEATLRRMRAEEARRRGFDDYELDAECVVPEEFAGDDELAAAYREAWAAAGEQAAKFKGKGKKRPKDPPAAADDEAA